VDWLLSHDLAPSRATGVALLAQLQRECYIKPVGPCKRLPRPIDCDLAFFRFGASSASRIAAAQLLHDHAMLKNSGGASGSPQQQKKKDQQPAVPRQSAFFEKCVSCRVVSCRVVSRVRVRVRVLCASAVCC
jgi:hypothetical protein